MIVNYDIIYLILRLNIRYKTLKTTKTNAEKTQIRDQGRSDIKDAAVQSPQLACTKLITKEDVGVAGIALCEV